ncbi:N-acetylglucosamine kinase [candidate division KSB1 bacterium]
MSSFIGIDGGGSITRAVMTDRDGNCLAAVSGPAANIQHVTIETLEKILLSLVTRLQDQSKTGDAPVQYIVAGFAGAGWPVEQKKVESVFNKLGFLENCYICSDIEIASEGALVDAPGVVLSVGTGSIAFGRDRDGEVVRAGGWGYLLGDEGSGYWIGLQAISRSLQSYDAAVPNTALSNIICQAFELNSIPEIVPLVYSEKVNREAIAALAPAVFDAARNKDAAALSILHEAADLLAVLVKTILKRHTIESPAALCLTGGIFEQRDILLPALLEHLRDEVILQEPRMIPAAGAVLMALRECNMTVNDHIIGNLSKVTLTGRVSQ